MTPAATASGSYGARPPDGTPPPVDTPPPVVPATMVGYGSTKSCAIPPSHRQAKRLPLEILCRSTGDLQRSPRVRGAITDAAGLRKVCSLGQPPADFTKVRGEVVRVSRSSVVWLVQSSSELLVGVHSPYVCSGVPPPNDFAVVEVPRAAPPVRVHRCVDSGPPCMAP